MAYYKSVLKALSRVKCIYFVWHSLDLLDAREHCLKLKLKEISCPRT